MKRPDKFGDYVYQYTSKPESFRFYVTSWVYNIRKDGSEGQISQWIALPFTEVRTCSKCGRFGRRNQIQSWGLYERGTSNSQILKTAGKDVWHGHMCLSCANKLRPKIRARNEYIDACYTINKLKRLIRENQNGN